VTSDGVTSDELRRLGSVHQWINLGSPEKVEGESVDLQPNPSHADQLVN
jgi:hypothetical protein